MTVPRSARTRVLLIDDDEKLNALIAQYLGRFNFSVRAVVHPEDGLHALKADPPDIVILDVMLPDMDGFAVCRKIREGSRVPIMMLTARGDVMDRIVGLELGHGIRTARQNVVSILDEVARNFHDRPPSVSVAPMTPEILVDIDADRMRTVIRNLLENAIKYSLPDSRAVEVSAAQNGEWVVIRVTDDGPGIPERDVPSLFEPFFRVDRSRSKKAGGYGLGLSISKRIVEAHGGTIAVENNAKRGASFVVTLPKPG